ncbi:MAG: hypothetical protein Q8P57_00125 [Candidatus Pacearchaeota archaeon]|nr:hypothetical protein [Candidatus Pacearchaeota archaeon]
MKEIFKKPYVYWFLGIFIFYLLLNVLISGFYNTIPLIVVYASTVNWFKLGLSLLLTLGIGFFVSANSILIYSKYKERKKCKGEGVSIIGAVGGLIVGVCPLCVTGIFPLVLGFLGVGFSFGVLPFQGLEVQALVLIALIFGFRMLGVK